MKFTIDLPSVALGCVCALALGALAAFAPQATSIPNAPDRDPIDTANARPHPRDFIWLEADNSTPSDVLTVPAGKILVITGTSKTEGPSGVRVGIRIDGSVRSFLYQTGGISTNFATGVPLTEGQSVRLDTVSSGRAWLHGYYADA